MVQMTTTQSVQMFLRALQGQNYSPKTLRAYGDDLTQFLTFVQKNRVDWDNPLRFQREDIEGCGFQSSSDNSTLAIQESTPGRSGKDGEAPSGNLVKSGGEVDITKLLSLLCPCHQALSWLPVSCYLVAGKMAKVESE